MEEAKTKAEELAALLKADEDERLKACGDAIAEALKRYNCRIRFATVFDGKQVLAEPQIVANPAA